MSPGGDTENAAWAALDAAFDRRDRHQSSTAAPRVGLFGNGLPEVLIAAAGAMPVHVNFGERGAADPESGSSISEIIEPFVDDEVRLFLLRLMEGDFADYRGIVFARDDAPALIAYQYATEWARQGRALGKVPPLFLWNLVHTRSEPVRRFNAVQAAKLFDFLTSIGLVRPDAPAVAAAAVHEQARRSRLEAMERAAIPGAVAMRWRNAGRFMAAEEHAALLDRAIAQLPASAGNMAGKRLGLVGSPLASKAAYACFEQFGTLVADLQPWGSPWPGAESAFDVDAILALNAAEPFCPRATPANVHRRALVAALVAARCDLVICQLAQTDDTFGWEVPTLKAELAARGIGFVNLGFRDTEPDRNWLDHAAGLIAAALEARP